MTGHGVALAILTDIAADPGAWAFDLTIDGTFGPKLRAQCECGWHASFAEVVSFDLLTLTIGKHLSEVLEGPRRTCFVCEEVIEPCGDNPDCVHVRAGVCVKHFRPPEGAAR